MWSSRILELRSFGVRGEETITSSRPIGASTRPTVPPALQRCAVYCHGKGVDPAPTPGWRILAAAGSPRRPAELPVEGNGASVPLAFPLVHQFTTYICLVPLWLCLVYSVLPCLRCKVQWELIVQRKVTNVHVWELGPK